MSVPWPASGCRTQCDEHLPRRSRCRRRPVTMGNAESTGDRSRDLYNAAKRGDVDGVARLHGQGLFILGDGFHMPSLRRQLQPGGIGAHMPRIARAALRPR